MAAHDPSASPSFAKPGNWWTRENALVLVLVVATALLLFLCWKILQPFLSPLAWALALAVIAYPLHGWLLGRVKRPGVAAALSVFLVTLVIVAPAVFVGHSVVREATEGFQAIQHGVKTGQWREYVSNTPWLNAIVSQVETQADLGAQMQGMAQTVGASIGQALGGSAWAVVELLLTLFVLFYLLRDRRDALNTLRSLVPLSESETDQVFHRVAETIRATVFGTLVVAAVQGTLGGLMFWLLGIPGAILWGAVMGLLAIIPVLGAFVIWVPAAMFLGISGDWGKAAILTAWGALAVGLVDNLLYPMLVGKQLRMHTVPVFFSVVGGLAVFGAAGLVLGPVILALTDAIIEVWRRRTANGRAAETIPRQA